jgi:hypothetical protein
MSDEQKEQQVEHVEALAVSHNAIEQMTRASIDIQISTAKNYPRSMQKFYQRAEAMVTMDESTAASCLYRRPVGKEGSKMVYAEGESIRLAEIVASCYGNIRVEGMIIDDGNPRYIKAIGVAHDLETNTACRADAIESTVTKNGVPFSERMRIVVGKAAQSKAIRDAIFRIVPKSLCKPLAVKAKIVAMGDAKTFDSRRQAVVAWIKGLKIDAQRVWDALGISGEKDITMEILIELAGIKTALDDKDVTVDDAFPKPESESDKGSTADRIKNKLKDKEEPPPGDATQEAAQTAPEPEIMHIHYNHMRSELIDDGRCPAAEKKKAETPTVKGKKAETKPKMPVEPPPPQVKPEPEHQYKCGRCERTAPEGGICKYCNGALLKIKK